MSEARVVAVGGSPAFRSQVARAVGRDSDGIDWTPSVTAIESLLAERDGPFDLIVLSPSISESDAVSFAQSVGAISPVTALVLVRERPPDGALPQLIRAGIRDVVDLSQGGQELDDALARALAWADKVRAVHGTSNGSGTEPQGRIITVFSSKGGSGKTLLACNLAAALNQMTGEDVALLDLDLELGDALPHFGKEPARSFQDLTAVEGWADPESVRRAGTLLDRGLWGFGSASAPGQDTVVGGTIGKALRVLRSTFAYTVLDTPAQYSDHVLQSFDVSDDICLVTALDVIGIRHLTMDLRTLDALGLPKERFRIVLNRANSKVGLTPTDVERVTRIKPDGLIPSSALVPASLNRGRVICIHEPRSPVARAVQAFAERLLMAPASKPSPAGVVPR
ncbi:MAG TPA: P-loop NTPase [Actinomycetota bacterium]|nr:P-loop NTPase [Actinomycetota bacterium]